MIKKIILLVLCSMLLAPCSAVEAQLRNRVPRIGHLNTSYSYNPARREAFLQGLHELGYADGKNIVIEWRSSEGKPDRDPLLAAELVRLQVDVIVSGGSTATRSAKEATVTIPIVMTQDSDPVGNGFVASLARPGGNITGLSNFAPELSGKRLELLREVVPSLSRAAVVWNGTNPVKVLDFKETEKAAHAFGLTLQSLELKTPKDFESSFKAATTQGSGALVVLQDALTISNATAIVEFATKNRLPAMYGSSEFVDVGGLMSYAANFPDLFRRAAVYVEKILNGTTPGDLPVQQPTKFEFIVNLKAAKQIGLTIPPNVLARADKVIR